MRSTDLLFDYSCEFPMDNPNKKQRYWRLKMYNRKGTKPIIFSTITLEPVSKYKWSTLSSSLTKTTNLMKENRICNSSITSIRLFTINALLCGQNIILYYVKGHSLLISKLRKKSYHRICLSMNKCLKNEIKPYILLVIKI